MEKKLSGKHNQSVKNGSGSEKPKSGQPGVLDEVQLERITRETLGGSKGFQKLLKKQAKEREAVTKRQSKERALMQRQHSGAIDKMGVSEAERSCSLKVGRTAWVEGVR